MKIRRNMLPNSSAVNFYFNNSLNTRSDIANFGDQNEYDHTCSYDHILNACSLDKNFGTVAIQYKVQDNYIFYVVAFCSPKDKFNVRTAKTLLNARMSRREEVCKKIPVLSVIQSNPIKHAIIADILLSLLTKHEMLKQGGFNSGIAIPDWAIPIISNQLLIQLNHMCI